jgi:ribose transport system ATP-binding protein
MTLLVAQGITKAFGGVVALDGVDLEAPAGRILGLLGANGSGKSTLCRVIAGEVMPDAGSLSLNGVPAAPASPQDAAKPGIVIAHQHPSLAPDLPVWENMFLGSEVCGGGGFINRRAGRRAARAMLAELGLDIDVDQSAGFLSAAQQQLLEIGRALSRDPRVLILDEPTAALSPALVAKLFEKVRALAARGTAIIFISHRLREVEEICDALVVLRNGQRVGSWETSGRLDEARILDLLTADSEAAPHSGTARSAGEVVLQLAGLRAGHAVRGVDLELRRGEIVGIAGLQGHGQEELLDAVAGFRHVDGGTILHLGKPVSPRIPRDMIRRGICLVPNDRHRQGLFMDQTVGENLGTVLVTLFTSPWRLPKIALRDFVPAVIKRLMIKTQGGAQLVATLSGGNQQKVVIGKWLARPIDVLLLSDPTKGVDIHARSEIYAQLGMLAAGGSSALVYASDIHELLLHCDRILVMYEGRVMEALAGTAMTEQRVLAASFGRAA